MASDERVAVTVEAGEQAGRLTLPRLAWTALGFGLVVLGTMANGWVAGPALDALDDGVAWTGVCAVACCSFWAALCATRWRRHATKPLVLALSFLGLHALAVLSLYETHSTPWTVIAAVTWPSLLFAVAFWARTAIAVAQQTELLPTAQRRPSKFGAMLWRHSTHVRLRLGDFEVWTAEIVLVWIPCLLFCVVSLLPGLAYTTAAPDRNGWRGWEFSAHGWYIAAAVWAAIVLAATALVLRGIWRGHAPGLPAGAVIRARAAANAGWGALALSAILLVGEPTGWWPAPILTLLAAIFVAAFALRALDADAYAEPASAYSSIRRRGTIGIVWIGVSLLVAAAFREGPVLTGVIAAVFAALLPLLPATLRALHGPGVTGGRSSVRQLRPREAEQLRAALAGYPVPPLASDLGEHLAQTSRSLESLAAEGMRLLLGGLPNHDGRGPIAEADPRRRSELVSFLETCPLFDGLSGFEERLEQYVRLVYDTNALLGADPTYKGRERLNPDDAPYEWILRAYCLMRITVATEPEAKLEEECERLRWRLWPRSEPNVMGDGKPVYSFPEIAVMTGSELNDALRAVRGRRASDRIKRSRPRALEAQLAEIKALWLRRLQRLAADDAKRSSRRRRKAP